MRQFTPPLFRDLLISGRRSPVTCVITDVIMRFPIEVAEELGIPVFSFCTFSARFLFLFFCIPNLFNDGQIPPKAGNTNQELLGVPGAEGLLRFKDLPKFWSSRTSGLIINTFDELEAPFLTSLSKIYKRIYTIGPIHCLLQNSPGGLWKEDHSCLGWLDSRSSRSVVFVCLGSLVKITRLHFMEVWNGLINSGKPFLLALRLDVRDENDEQKELMKEIMETNLEGRCLVVSWAPQEEVLAHEVIGGFLTQGGWNSILESIVARVPMICWPQIGDQPGNCTWVTKIWKIGFEMKDRYDRSMIETMIRSIIEQKDEIMTNTIVELRQRVKRVVSKDGISNRNLKILVEDIKKIKLN